MNDNTKALHHVAFTPTPTVAWAFAGQQTIRKAWIAKTKHHRLKMALPKNRAP